MTQIHDAPWIKDAELNGYPVGDDSDIEDIDITCPMPPSWLWSRIPKGENYD